MIALYFDYILDLVIDVLGYNLTYHMLLVLSNFDVVRKWKKSTFLNIGTLDYQRGGFYYFSFGAFMAILQMPKCQAFG
jgi:hypothetical protein